MKIFRNSLLTILVIPTIGAVLHPYCSPLVASYLYIFTLLIYPLCIINILLFIWGLYTHSTWGGIYAFLSLLTLNLVKTSLAFSFTTDEKESKHTIRIVSWNVDNFQLNKDFLLKSATFIKKKGADIICLQERPHTNLLSWDTIQSTFKYMYSVKNNREDEVLNLSILSKWPLNNLQEIYFPDTYNKLLLVDVCHPDGLIRLINVHLQTTGITDTEKGKLLKVLQKNAEYRYRQTDTLVSLIEKSLYPVVVCGDFNDTPLSYSYRKLSCKLQDCFVKSGNGWGATFQLFNLFRIDYLFCTDRFQVNNYQLYANCWSDHKIQCGDLAFKKVR